MERRGLVLVLFVSVAAWLAGCGPSAQTLKAVGSWRVQTVEPTWRDYQAKTVNAPGLHPDPPRPHGGATPACWPIDCRIWFEVRDDLGRLVDRDWAYCKPVDARHWARMFPRKAARAVGARQIVAVW